MRSFFAIMEIAFILLFKKGESSESVRNFLYFVNIFTGAWKKNITNS